MLIHNRNKRFFLLLSLFFQVSCFSNKHALPEELISTSYLKEDFAILRKTLEEAHPGLYWYSGKIEMDNYFDNSEAAIENAMTRIEFFKFLLPVIANIRCVHTYLQLPADTASSLEQFARLLAFDFHCQNGKLYISKALNKDGHESAEIVAINNFNTKKILDTLLTSLPADGYNEAYKYYLLSKGAFREGMIAKVSPS